MLLFHDGFAFKRFKNYENKAAELENRSFEIVFSAESSLSNSVAHFDWIS